MQKRQKVKSVLQILEANPEYIQYLIKVGDQYKLNKQALEDWNAINKEQELAIDNQMGGNKYLESYDSVLSDIANPASHGNGDGVGGTGISEQLDDLIAKNKELNNSFLNGEITASEYFSNLSGYITSSGLEDALHSLNGEFDDTTDYIEETVIVKQIRRIVSCINFLRRIRHGLWAILTQQLKMNIALSSKTVLLLMIY